MTDDTTWQAPGSASQPASAGIPPNGQQMPPPPQPNPNIGWAPPPKPGLIPLRPLAFGTILGATFQVMRRNPRATFGIAVILYGFITVVIGGTYFAIISYYSGALNNSTGDDTSTFAAGFVAAIVLALLVPVALSVVATAILEGIISLEVARGTVGEKLKVRGLWRLARGKVGALIGWSFIVIGALTIAIVVVTLIIAALAALGGVAGIVGAILLGLLFFAGLVVMSAWIGTKLSLVPSVLMLERLPLRAAIGRSWSLTRGFFWKTLGIQLLVNVIVSTALQIISLPVSLVFNIGSGLLNPNGDASTITVTSVVALIVLGITTIVLGAIGLVTQSAVVALIYIDIRMRKEGLDLELLRFVEARQAGDASVGDPYLVGTTVSKEPAPGSGSPWS
jgi:hypothetical protein